MKPGEMNSEGAADFKQIVLRLRWVTIIITSYLILFGRGINSPQFFPSLLISFYLFSNLIAYLLPPSHFSKLSFFYIVLLFDTLMVSLGIYVTSQFDTDFYLVYFLIILFASVARSLKLLIINALVICGIYGWFLWTEEGNLKSLEEGILLRVPFIFIMNLFYGFLVQSFEKRTKQIKIELEELEKSELRYRQIVEGAHDAVAILDEKGGIRFFNGRLISITQYSSQELTGMGWTRIMRGFGADEMKRICNRRSDRGLGEEWVVQEAEVVQKNGEARKVEVSGAQFFLSTEKTHVILYLRDITDKKLMEEKMIQTEKLNAVGEMAAGVAHDLNNVLGAILGRVQLLKLGLMKKRGEPGRVADEAVVRELEVVERASIDGAHTIQKIREFARSKKDSCQFVLVDVNEVLDGVIELARTKIKDEAEAKGIQIEVQIIKGEVPLVMGNPDDLREVLLNLLLNSMDAMPEGGRVTLRTRRENEHVFIEANDNGCGIPESIRKRILDPFFTTKGVQRAGLGLSVSYGIIRRHNGEIQVKSREGKGSTFTIRLPVSREEWV